MRHLVALLALALLAVGCTGGSSSEPSGSPLSETAVRFRILDKLNGDVTFCGPPVVMTPRIEELRQELRSLRHDPELYRAILEHEGVQPGGRRPVPTVGQLERIVRTYQEVRAISLRKVGDRYAFHAYVQGGDGEELVSGIVDQTGAVLVQHRTAASQNCPICLARGVLISTPRGPIPVERVRDGMKVWTVDRSGRRLSAIVLRTAKRRAVGDVLEIQLEDGRVVVASPLHPTADGRLVGGLARGGRLAGSRVASIRAVPYDGFTYDLLPSGPTGDYVADGVLLGSTLSHRASALSSG